METKTVDIRDLPRESALNTRDMWNTETAVKMWRWEHAPQILRSLSPWTSGVTGVIFAPAASSPPAWMPHLAKGLGMMSACFTIVSDGILVGNVTILCERT